MSTGSTPACRLSRRLLRIGLSTCAAVLVSAAPAAAQTSLFDRAFGKDVEATPFVCTVAEGCVAGGFGSAAGHLKSPDGVAVDGGHVYVADTNNDRVMVFTTAGVFEYAFGKDVKQGGGDVCVAGETCQAGSFGGAAGQLNFPQGVAVDGGHVYVADTNNDRVSVFTTAGVFEYAFGKDVKQGGGDVCVAGETCQAGSFGGAAGQLNLPQGVAVDGGHVYVGETNNDRVSVFTTAGVFEYAFGKDVKQGGGDVCQAGETCQAASFGGAAGRLNLPQDVAVDGGHVYVADTNNHRVSVFTTAGVFEYAFGKDVKQGGGDVCAAGETCQAGSAGGAAGQLFSPQGVAVDGGDVYVADTSNDRVSVFTTAGVFVRAFGKDVKQGGGDVCAAGESCQAGSAGGAAGQLNVPEGVAVDGGHVYVADTSNRRVSVFTTAGVFVRAFARGVDPDGLDI